MRGTSGMREDVGETETHERMRARECSDGLLDALIRHHPDHGPAIITRRKVEISDDGLWLRGRIAEMDCRLAALSAQNKEQQALILRQRDLIFKMREIDEGEYPRIAEVIDLVCAFYKVSKSQMMGGQRSAQLTLPRHVIYYLAREVTKMSLPEIGRKLGGRDHTTILHGTRRIERLLKDDFKLQDDLDVLRAKIDAHVLDRRVAAMSTAA